MLHTHLLPLKEEGQTNAKETELYKEKEYVQYRVNVNWNAIRGQQHTQREKRKSYRACAGLLPPLDLTLGVARHTLPCLSSKLTPLPAFKAKIIHFQHL